MAFTNTTLSISPLLETTFISDMRIIVNSNVTVLKSKVEDIINTLQIDLVNKYIGTDLPLGKIYTQDLIVTNQLEVKNGIGSGATTIASLTQSSGFSTFTADNLQFRATLRANANTSRAAIKTVVVGGTSGPDLLFPTSGGAGVPDPGLYVGDTNTPVFAGFYGNTKFEKSAISHSVISTPRVIQVTTNNSPSYAHGILSLSRTDPQVILLNIQLGDNGAQTASRPIYLGLHDLFTTGTSRPYVGQSFTILINSILNANGSAVAPADWPQPLGGTTNSAALSIIPGWTQSSSAGNDAYKIGYVNSGFWTAGGGFPTTGPSAVAALGSGMTNTTWIRLYAEEVQTDQSISDPLGASITLTKIAEEVNSSRYVITSGSNYRIING
jgi:hypothetical protein